MQIQNNPYSQLQQYQQPIDVTPRRGPSILPIEENPITVPEEDFKPKPDPEKLNELQDRLYDGIKKISQYKEEKADDTRAVFVGHTAIESVKTRFEIYMNGMTQSDNFGDSGSSSIEFMETLREIEAQNNAVKAYAAYQEFALEA